MTRQGAFDNGIQPEDAAEATVVEGSNARSAGEVTMFAYWCETCRKAVADKRCPLCGLKAKKLKG